MKNNDVITVENEGHIAWVILCRPQKRNAFKLSFFTKFAQVFQQISEDPAVRVVVIRAEGKDFSVGMDLQDGAAELILDASAETSERLRLKILGLQESITTIEKCRKPVIAAIHGYCLGGGIDITSACDIRIASKDAIFSIRETKMAIVADMGTLQRVPTIIGQGWFRELALTGRNFAAAEALEMGYITHICEDRESLLIFARDLAQEIAANSPLTVQGTKDVINFSRDNGIHAGLDYVAQKNAGLLFSEDIKEAFQAFMEKRSPEFKGE